MFDQVAFQFGVFATLATLTFTFTIWILAAVNRLRIESVGILQKPFLHLCKININAIELILGWFPLGSFVKIAGMMEEPLNVDLDTPPITSTDTIPTYEFRSRPIGIKLLVLMTSPLLLILIGLLFLNSTSLPLLEFATTYLNINFFQLPIEAGAPIWDAFYNNPIFLFGSIFLFLGFGNLGNNLGSLLNSKFLTWFFFFLPLSFLLLSLGIFRLIWSTFAWINIGYFLIGGLSTGIIGFLLAILLAKFLPNT